MSFKVNDEKLFKKYTKIWERVSNLININFYSEPVYGDNDKYIKTKVKFYGDKINTNLHKVKFYGDKINTNFQGKKTPKKCII